MAKKVTKDKAPKVHENLSGFNIKINEFGEVSTNFAVDRLNSFLDENVDDKKLRDRDEEEE